MGVEEYRSDLNDIFLKSGVTIFSEVAVKGFRFTKSQMSSDSGVVSKMDPAYSVVSFALVEVLKAKNVLSEIENFNKSQQRARPLHAFQINVEAAV